MTKSKIPGAAPLVFTVTGHPDYDQRMIRICGALAGSGRQVLLIGRRFSDEPAPVPQGEYAVDALRCRIRRGVLAYAEFNLKLLLRLFRTRAALICAIDLDTILPCYLLSAIRGIPRVYDAHELFCEMKEIATRPLVRACWKSMEKMLVPRFRSGYTVNRLIAEEFHRMYGVRYGVIRNLPPLLPIPQVSSTGKYLLYQGAVNEGRCFEALIPAMNRIAMPLVVCGTGNFMKQARELVRRHRLEDKVIFRGRLQPAELRQVTAGAWLGLNLVEHNSLNNYYSLANRFFDYMHAGLPQICVDFPAYREIVSQHPFALLLGDTSPSSIADAVNGLLADESQYLYLRQQCLLAREQLNWDQEKKQLLRFYDELDYELP